MIVNQPASYIPQRASLPSNLASFPVSPLEQNFTNSMGPSGADDSNPGMKSLNSLTNTADQGLPPNTPYSSSPNDVNKNDMGSFAQTPTPPELQQNSFQQVLQQQQQQEQQPFQQNEQTPSNAPNLDVLLNAIGMREGGGNVDYQLVQGSGPNATYGKYQIRGSMIAQLTQQLFGRAMTPQEFLQNPAAQDAVAKEQLQEALQYSGGDPVNAIAIWFTGKPLEGNAMDSNGVPLSQYVGEVMNLAQQQTSQV